MLVEGLKYESDGRGRYPIEKSRIWRVNQRCLGQHIWVYGLGGSTLPATIDSGVLQ